MKITVLVIGKTEEAFLKSGIEIFEKRIKHYISLNWKIIPSIKNTKNISAEKLKQKEAEQILKHISENDYMVLCDERGEGCSSLEFSKFIERSIMNRISNLVFVIGGAYGVDNSIFDRANSILSFSKMTFSHQIIRVFFMEQLYRALTIMKKIPYHHE